MKMHKLTSTITPSVLTLALWAPLTGGCADVPGDAGESADTEIAQTAEVSEAALRIEQAERLLDRGHDIQQAQALLTETLAISDIIPEERAAALLALSRAHEVLGETEKAIGVIEDEIARNAGNHDWAGRSFNKRLRQLLTGSKTAPGPKVPLAAPVAPFAKVLLDYFPPSPDGAVQAKFYLAGGTSAVSNELGTFNLHGALRTKREQECPLCDLDVTVGVSVSRSDWLLIPRSQAEFAEGMTVFYFDLGDGRIPERYEAHLPMKVADIVSELEAGKSFVVAKERPGSPPALLLAAPRAVMLPVVENHLSQLDELPTEPRYFEVSPRLRPEEIRAVIRGQWLGDLRSCYDQLLTNHPQAGGKIEADLKVDGDGRVTFSKIRTDDEVLQQPRFMTCLDESVVDLEFPTSGGETTITYPLRLTPN